LTAATSLEIRLELEMKSIATSPSSASSTTFGDIATSSRRPSPPKRIHDPDSPYVSAKETRDLLSNSLAARQARLAAGDMVSTDDAARHVGTTRVTINSWVDKGRCIGLTQTKRGFRIPVWQFEPQFWDIIPDLSKALGSTDGWALLSFLESPLGALNGLTPRVAIEQGQAARVLAIAAHEGN
jgi:hypothetical protein